MRTEGGRRPDVHFSCDRSPAGRCPSDTPSMYGTVCPPSGVAQIDAWCFGEGIARLLAAAPVGILIDAKALTLRVGHVLADTAPEFAAAALGAIAELHQVGPSRGCRDLDLAELAALRFSGCAPG